MTNPRSLIFGVCLKSLLLSPLCTLRIIHHFSASRNLFTERKHSRDSNKIVGQMSKELGRKFSLVKMEKIICYLPLLPSDPCNSLGTFYRWEVLAITQRWNFSIFTHFLCFFLLKLLKLGKIGGVKSLTWKSGGVNFWTNSMSAFLFPNFGNGFFSVTNSVTIWSRHGICPKFYTVNFT